ncbi:MAG: hypothetical protein E6K99_02880 [Thaumarchaeota archaeon]|nr:MAG: hypothetical protein E6K99_02880 [Nitrososphaerota archaeon]
MPTGGTSGSRLHARFHFRYKLASIDKLQKDIGQIRTWPFDAQILERLVAIIVTVVAIMVAHYIQVVLP